MRTADVVIIGSGIIGAAAAYALAERGITDVLVVEQEDLPNRHSSGRNASYYLPIYDTACFTALAQASLPFFLSPPDSFDQAPLLEARGAVIAATSADEDALRIEMEEAHALGILVEELSPVQVPELVPIVRTDWFACAAFYPEAGPLDVHALSMGYLRGARQRGIAVLHDERVSAIRTAGNRVSAVETSSGPLACRLVVNAAGAWAGLVGRLAGARPITFVPRRRHIVSLPLGPDLATCAWPFFRCPSLPLYFKAEAGQLLASRMDADVDEPGDCMTDDLHVADVADTVAAYTTLPVRRIARAWAGHRTFSPDGAPVIGRDPIVEGFIWAAGLGGAGVMSSPEVGQLVADAVTSAGVRATSAMVDPSRPNLESSEPL